MVWAMTDGVAPLSQRQRQSAEHAARTGGDSPPVLLSA
jgi:hypothetical protein